MGRADSSAETVFFSSGLGGVASYWAPQAFELAERYAVITYDQSGTGRSAGALPDPYDVADMANDVVAILDAAGRARVHFVGHALGGLIGLEMAARTPARLASLVVVNAWAALDPHTARCFSVRRNLLLHVGVAAYVQAQPIFLYPAHWLAANEKRIAAEEAHGIAHFQGTETLLRRIDAASRFDITARLGAIETPTLVCATRDDVLVPYSCAFALAAKIPKATLDLAASGGHASNVTDPETFNRTLIRFLAGLPRGGH